MKGSGPGRIEGGRRTLTCLTACVAITTPNGKTIQRRLAVDTGCGLGLVMLSKTFVDRNDVLNDISNPVPEPRYGTTGQQPRVVSARFGKFAGLAVRRFLAAIQTDLRLQRPNANLGADRSLQGLI